MDIYPDMEFSAYIVKPNTDKTVKVITNVVMIGVLALLLACIIGVYTIAAWLFGLIVVITVLLAIVKKGKIQESELSKDKLIITPEKITINEKVYEIRKIKDMQFIIHSYSGINYMTPDDEVWDAMSNSLSFTVNEQKINCAFFISGLQHALSLRQIFEEFYKNETSFIELDMSRRKTYLFQPVA